MAAGFDWLLLRLRLTPRMSLALGGLGAPWVIFRADWRALASLLLGRGEAIYFTGWIAHAPYTPLVRKPNQGGARLGLYVSDHGCAVVHSAGLGAEADPRNQLDSPAPP